MTVFLKILSRICGLLVCAVLFSDTHPKKLVLSLQPTLKCDLDGSWCDLLLLAKQKFTANEYYGEYVLSFDNERVPVLLDAPYALGNKNYIWFDDDGIELWERERTTIYKVFKLTYTVSPELALKKLYAYMVKRKTQFLFIYGNPHVPVRRFYKHLTYLLPRLPTPSHIYGSYDINDYRSPEDTMFWAPFARPLDNPDEVLEN